MQISPAFRKSLCTRCGAPFGHPGCPVCYTKHPLYHPTPLRILQERRGNPTPYQDANLDQKTAQDGV